MNFKNKVKSYLNEPSMQNQSQLYAAAKKISIDLIGEIDKSIVSKAVKTATKKFDIDAEDGMKKALIFIKKRIRDDM